VKTRGRPRHPEVLTPRQQEVWHLLREGLTNEEIAGRLGISLDGAKYHVSEVLRRLGVDNRYDAAALEPEAVAAARPRWAWAAAPLVFAKKLKLGALAYVASGVALGAAAVGVGLLTWGVATSNDGDRAAVADATRTPIPRTNIAELDHVIDLLVNRDVDGLSALAELAPVRCSTAQTIGSPPPCPPGAAEGTPVDAFNMAQCEGFYVTTREQIRQSFGATLARQPSTAIYAVLRDTAPDHPYPSYTIAVTADRPSQATADVSFWQVRAGDGAIVYMMNQCAPVGASQQVAYQFPNPDFILGPYNNCLVPPGDTANFIVTVEGLSPGGIKPQFWGPAKTTLETDTGARAIVSVTGDTQWITAGFSDRNALDHLRDVRAGEVLQAVGKMGDDCVLTAQTILAPLPASPTPSP